MRFIRERLSMESRTISDFLTGQRREKDETEWLVVERPELRMIEDEVFGKSTGNSSWKKRCI